MITLKIEGMSCQHCVDAVRKALSQVPGVEQVTEVSLDRGEAVVAGHPDVAALLDAVKEEGYEARPA